MVLILPSASCSLVNKGLSYVCWYSSLFAMIDEWKIECLATKAGASRELQDSARVLRPRGAWRVLY